MDVIVDGLSKALESAFDIIGEILSSSIMTSINNLVGIYLYFIDTACCLLIKLVYSMFSVFAGMDKVIYYSPGKYGQKIFTENYLINIFFEHSTINKIYWGMALIGILLAFVFAIWAVIKKAGDLRDKEKRTLSEILGDLFRSILIILLMNFIVTSTISFTNALMKSITNLFNDPDAVTRKTEIDFDSDDYICMNEIFQTIGAFSLNPSYESRYNLNSCFNAIRPQLLYLEQKGMFDFYYESQKEVTLSDGQKSYMVYDTWQSVLQKIVRSTSLTSNLKVDVYHAETFEALKYAMNVIKNDKNFHPLAHYETKNYAEGVSNVSIDVIIFLMGTNKAAKNSKYNENPSFTDAVRGPYYSGQKSIYNYESVKEDFKLSVDSMHHLLVILLCYLVGKELISISLSCITRIFYMVLLYLVAPPFVATMPLDNGEKFRQWGQSFVVQAFSVFGSVISMRILMLFIGIVFSTDLIVFENYVLLDWMAKIFIMYGGIVAVEKAGGMVTGIIAGNGSHTSMQTSDAMAQKGMQLGNSAGFIFKAPVNTGVQIAKAAGKGTMAVGGGVTSLAQKGFSALAYKIGSSGNSEEQEKQEAQRKSNAYYNGFQTPQSTRMSSSKLGSVSNSNISSQMQPNTPNNSSVLGKQNNAPSNNNTPVNSPNLGNNIASNLENNAPVNTPNSGNSLSNSENNIANNPSNLGNNIANNTPNLENNTANNPSNLGRVNLTPPPKREKSHLPNVNNELPKNNHK